MWLSHCFLEGCASFSMASVAFSLRICHFLPSELQYSAAYCSLMCCTSGSTSHFSYYLSGYFLALCLCYLYKQAVQAPYNSSLSVWEHSGAALKLNIWISLSNSLHLVPQMFANIYKLSLSQEFLIKLLHLATGLRMFSFSKTLALGHTPSV